MAGRPKKNQTIKEGILVPVEIPLQPWQRCSKGLISGVEHKFKNNGFVDWRKMIDNKHVVLNSFIAATKGIDIANLGEEQLTKAIEEAPEEDLLIKLAGFREVALLRGYNSINSELLSISNESVTIRVTINWLPNFENPTGLTVSAIANASLANTDDRFAKFLETIAENRAFVRAVRHSLGILAVGQDEFKQEDIKTETKNLKIQSLLSDLMNKIGLDFDGLKQFTEQQGIEWSEKWINVEKIDPAAVMTLIPMLKKVDESKK